MEKDLILKKESLNDGQSIYLSYDKFYGLYIAFGLSAYYATMVVDPYLSFSETENMPVAFFSKRQIGNMCQSLRKVEHTQGCSYEFRTRVPIGTEGYEKWKDKVKTQHDSI